MSLCLIALPQDYHLLSPCKSALRHCSRIPSYLSGASQCFLLFSAFLLAFGNNMNTCLVKVLPFTDCWFFYLYRLLWLLLTSQGSLLLLALADSPLRPPQLWTYSFHLIPAWFTLRVPNSYGTLSCFADLSTLLSLRIKFLYVRSDVCLRLPSDSTSRWIPLLSAVAFPLLGRLGDLHPL